MSRTTIGFGLLLIVIGVAGFLMTLPSGAHVTALIPAVFGLLIAGCGLLARNESKRKHAMHGAAFLALLGLGGCAMGVPKLIKWLSAGVTPERPVAVIDQTLTAVVLLVFLILCIKSFIAARADRASA